MNRPLLCFIPIGIYNPTTFPMYELILLHQLDRITTPNSLLKLGKLQIYALFRSNFLHPVRRLSSNKPSTLDFGDVMMIMILPLLLRSMFQSGLQDTINSFLHSNKNQEHMCTPPTRSAFSSCLFNGMLISLRMIGIFHQYPLINSACRSPTWLLSTRLLKPTTTRHSSAGSQNCLKLLRLPSTK